MATMALKIDYIYKNGTVNLSSNQAEDMIFGRNYVYPNVTIKGLDLTTCHVGDILLVDIGADGKTFSLVKNASADKSDIKVIGGRLKIQPGSVIVKPLFGDKMFNNVDLGDYAGKCFNNDLVEIQVVYDKKGMVTRCYLIKNTSALQREQNAKLTGKQL